MEEQSRPRLRFPEFSDDWEEKKTKDIAPLQRGFDLPTTKVIEGKYPVVYSNGILRNHNEYKVQAPGVVTGRSGTIGRITYVDKDYWPHNTSLWVTSFYDNIPKFIYYFYLNFDLGRYNAGSTVPTLNRNDVHSVKKRIPSIKEQQKIASFLSEVDKKINLLQQKRSLLEDYKKGVMQQIFSQELRFKSKDGGKYPEWEEKKLGEIGEVVNGLTYSPNDVDENGVLVLRSSNVQNRVLTFDDNVFVNVQEGNYNPVEENDILICVRNGSKRLIGKNAIINKEVQGVAFGAFMAIYRSKYNNFIFHLFDTDMYKKQVHRNLGATINSINGSDLKKFKIPFPCQEEQTHIANFLSTLDEKVQLVSSQIEQTQQFKKGLLQQMFV